MAMTDVASQFMPWTPLASHAATRWLQDHGLPDDVERLADALYADANVELVVGAAPVRPAGRNLFDIGMPGRWAALQPVEDDGGNVVDLIAWHPAAPDRWRFLTGEGEALGLIERDIRLEADGPIIVYETPLSWLRAGGKGLCFLVEDWAVAQRILIAENHVGAENADLGRRLDRCLRYRPSPQILVLEQAA